MCQGADYCGQHGSTSIVDALAPLAEAAMQLNNARLLLIDLLESGELSLANRERVLVFVRKTEGPC